MSIIFPSNARIMDIDGLEDVFGLVLGCCRASSTTDSEQFGELLILPGFRACF
jgi:hypothetical protein